MDDDKAAFGQVENWLRSLGLICYAQSFYDNGYEDLDVCKEIKEGDLDAIGINNANDRNDILAAVIRLNQKAVYFELEPEEEEQHKTVQKLDPYVLLTRVKAELEDGNIQLTQPPYFYPDGSLGNLHSLAETLGFKLETHIEDVLGALEQLRRKQLPTGLYNDIAEMMEEQRRMELKTSTSMSFKHSIHNQDKEEPKDYLNCEVPFKRSVSLSKHDKRKSKSTTNLAEAVLDSKSMKKELKKRKAVEKSNSVYDKQHRSILGISIRKRHASGGKKDHSVASKANTIESGVPAKDITLDQEQLKTLMTKVKHGEMTQEKVLDEVQKHYRQSMSFDNMTPINLPQKTSHMSKKEKKLKEKEEKEKKKKQKAERKMSSKHGQSLFYTADEVSDQKISISSVLNEEHMDDMVALGHSSGSDLSRESPDLKRYFNQKTITNTRNKSPATVSQDSLNSSTGSISSGAGSTGSQELATKSRSNSLRSLTKSNKIPPPIPNREDHLVKLNDDHNSLSSFAIKRNSLRSSLSAPPSKSTTPIAPMRNSSDSSKKVSTGKMTSSRSLDQVPVFVMTSEKKPEGEEEPPAKTDVCNDDIDKKVFQVKSFPFAGKDLDEIKRRSENIKRRSLNNDSNSVTHTTIPSPKPESPRIPPKPPKRSDVQKDSKQTEITPALGTNDGEEMLGCVSDESKVIVPRITENLSSAPDDQKEIPKAPPRASQLKRITEGDAAGKDEPHNKNESRPLIPPRKNRSSSYTPSSSDPANQQHDATACNTFPSVTKTSSANLEADKKEGISNRATGVLKPLKPKPLIPPRDRSAPPKVSPTDSSIRKQPPLTTNNQTNEDSTHLHHSTLSKPGVELSEEVSQVTREDSNSKANKNSELTSIALERIRRKIKAKPLKDLISRKLKIENVDLTERHYTNQDGSWKVPYSFVERYAEELKRPLREIIDNMDGIRTEILSKRKQPFQHCNVDEILKSPNTAFVTSSVDEWLISIGLPMFVEDFSEVGVQTLHELKGLSQDDVFSLGVYEMRHIERLFRRLKEV